MTSREPARTDVRVAGPPADGSAADEASTLILTGERTLPGIPDERYWFARHVVAYEQAARAVRAATARNPGVAVLDAGCGEGYGLPMLAAAGASRVIGVDLDQRVVEHVQRTYADGDPRIEAVTAELMSLPIADDVIDVTVSFQVIEHLHDVPGYLASLRRVTRPGGTLLVSTPNRLTFTPDSDVPTNPFHTREFTAGELAEELERGGWAVGAMLGIRHGRSLADVEARRGSRLPELLAEPPEHWDPPLRALVHATGPEAFEVGPTDLDTALDLLVSCRPGLTRRDAA